MEKSHNKYLGDQGEQEAVRYLLGKGYQILEKNWRFGHLEIDIIAEKDGVLKVIEVKARSNDYFGAPETFVNRRKIQHLVRAANAYVRKKDFDCEVCFDIIAIDRQQGTINHIEDAFRIF